MGGKAAGAAAGRSAALLREAAAAAFRRREFKTCDRLTAEAQIIERDAAAPAG